ncbi:MULTISPECIES: metallophosphoesterase family protein [Sorangium]|uniref:metallophosphoesterase family protein n=1 Tax=Sorangium TaxID=39643 RepID=UPI003D9C57F4
MLRILHSADWQVGLRARHVASAGDLVREARLHAARQCVETANREGVDAVVLAGDTFEDNLVDDRLVEAVVQLLATSRSPVYVLPGNHDALSHDSVYRRASWKRRPEHVILLDGREPVPIAHTDAFLVSAPIMQKKGFADPTRDMARAPEGAIAIGVAHGSLRIEGQYSPDDFPIALDAAQRAGLDYLALGHWHGHYAHDEKTVYAGTHETTKFGEERSGQALVVEIASRGSPAKWREFRTGSLRWWVEDVDLSMGVDVAVASVRRKIEDLEDPKRTLLRLRTKGLSSDGAENALRTLQEELTSKLLYFALERADVTERVAQGRLAHVARESALVSGLLQDLGCASSEGGVAPSLTTEKAQAARSLLGEFVTEVWS